MLGIGMICVCLWLVFLWDMDNIDFDFYVVMFDGEYVWYGNIVLKNSGVLDMDVMMGYGFEIFVMFVLIYGCYQVYINYYGGRSEMELIIV